MPDTIRHVTASAFTDGDASAWTRMFVSYNGPRQSFNGAYDEPWFRRAMENHGLELFTVSSARGKQRLLGIMLVFFDLSPLKPEHGLPGVYVDSTTFGTRLGKVGAFAGEAYLKGEEERAMPQLMGAVMARASELGVDCLIGSMSIEPLDPTWGPTLRHSGPVLLDQVFPHSTNGTMLRRMVIPIRDGLRFEPSPNGISIAC